MHPLSVVSSTERLQLCIRQIIILQIPYLMQKQIPQLPHQLNCVCKCFDLFQGQRLLCHSLELCESLRVGPEQLWDVDVLAGLFVEGNQLLEGGVLAEGVHVLALFAAAAVRCRLLSAKKRVVLNDSYAQSHDWGRGREGKGREEDSRPGAARQAPPQLMKNRKVA
jgi:hypothetical protein